MEEFESYFEKMNFNFSSWNDILENENIEIRSHNGEISDQNVQLLPRRDVSLYGIIPKMEKRFFSSCKECKHVFNPRDILLHKKCSLKVKSQHISHFKKKVISKKKLPIPLPPLFPTSVEVPSSLEELNTTELRPNSIFIVDVNELPSIDADANPILAKISPLIEDVGDIPLPSILEPHIPSDGPLSSDKTTVNCLDKITSKSDSSNSHSCSKSKKKKYSKYREPDSNTHCGLVLDAKGPSTRSIKYSNHSSEADGFLRQKSCLSLDSQFFSQSSQEMSDIDPVLYMPMSPVSTILPLQENDGFIRQKSCSSLDSQYFSQSTDIDPVLYMPMSPVSTISSLQESDSFLRQKSSLSLDSQYFSQNSDIDPVLYMPMSPVSTLSSLQIIQDGELLCFDSAQQVLTPTDCSHKIYFTIPEQLSMKMYKTRPKPGSLPLYGSRNIGGAIVISKQKLVNQRKDILAAINRKHKCNDIISDGNKDQQNSNHDVQLSLLNIK